MRPLLTLLLATTLPFSTPLAQTSTSAEPPSYAPEHHGAKAPIPPSTSLTLTLQGRTSTLSPDDLLALPQTTVRVHNAHANADETYTGPLVADVLARGGLLATQQTEILHSAVLATGTDGYVVLFSAAELMPTFSRSQAIVALKKAGLPNTEGGNLQLINTDGAKPDRWVHSLTRLNVVTITPQH